MVKRKAVSARKAVSLGAAVALFTGAGIAWAAEWGHKAAGTDWPDEFAGCSFEEFPNQSPIDIQQVLAAPSSTVLDINYPDETDLIVTNNSHTVRRASSRAARAPGITVDKGDGPKTYNLLQFHWHTPSENEFSGYDQDAEVHFVHQDPSDGSLAVVGVLYDTGNANAKLRPFFNAGLPDYLEPDVEVEDIRLADVIPSGVRAYNFAGGLTTPPCGAAVDWYVMDTVDSLSQSQMGQLRELFSGEEFPSGNARIVQRVVVPDLTMVAVQ
jgi:carbonic anhydrase